MPHGFLAIFLTIIAASLAICCNKAFLIFRCIYSLYMFGDFLRWSINSWLNVTGKKLSLKEHPWLRGPVSEGNVVGEDFYQRFANSEGLVLEVPDKGGLLPDFNVVTAGSAVPASKLHPGVKKFYEQTVLYKLEVWGQWFTPISLFAKVLIGSVSRKMKQLNIPLSPLETSHGMSSEIIQLKDPSTGEVKYTCWLRKSVKTNNVVYAGFYTSCTTNTGKTFVKVVFPLPKGNVTVLLKAEVQQDGSVKLLSSGRKTGDAGYYRVLKIDDDKVKVRSIPLKESIHVFEDKEGVMRTDHEFRFWGMKFLHLHYKINPA
jgi:hypothetical protein